MVNVSKVRINIYTNRKLSRKDRKKTNQHVSSIICTKDVCLSFGSIRNFLFRNSTFAHSLFSLGLQSDPILISLNAFAASNEIQMNLEIFNQTKTETRK